ncbi:GH92 family glycosyl hydrolase [uncultured Aeromicrobium sp.]|uniref:GH92 family glycosyl hydrolase n=1 Tax=uncultured Aeromicrobium sp. TaxID=337820 RepID=UPI0026011038|nr:GH92 family glycosyl hydrolase [uncultured Aeromicrobium sp.]
MPSAYSRSASRPGWRRLVVTVTAAALGAGALVMPALAQAAEDASTITPFEAVDQFIGTEMNRENRDRGNDHYGNTYPGATVPFGMVQLSPTTYRSSDGEQFGGYEYSADQLRGFGMTRLSGTGCRPNYGGNDFPMLPFTGELADDGTLPRHPGDEIASYFVDFDHADETAEPGYYAVELDAGVDVELTSTQRAGISRYTFDDEATILVNAAGSNNAVHDANISYDPQTGVLSGEVTANIVCNGGSQYTVYFATTFDQPVESYGAWDRSDMAAGRASATTDTKHGAGMWLTFADGAEVTATTGLSYVSTDGALANARQEVNDADFDEIRAQVRSVWEEALGTIDVTGGSEEDRISFYTSLYHSLLHPNVFQDVDGRYTGFDGEVHTVEEGRDFYVNFSGWDAYRGQMQLVALLYPERGSDINQSIVDSVEQLGAWTNWPTYNQGQTKMSGDSLQTILASVDAFGSTDYDRATALASMVETQKLPATASTRADAALYGALGFVPAHRGNAATSRTLEYATNDFSIAQLAARLGDDDAYQLFTTRSQNWKNIFNFEIGHIDARNGGGFQNTPLNTQGSQFDQSTGKQYGFNVTHNMASLNEARGGVDKAKADLDALLVDLDGGAFSETAYIANQPSFTLPWTYHWLQDPAATTDTLYRAVDEQYPATPDGLYGNDDLGSLSSWNVWARLGLMPAIWGTSNLLVSAPMFERVTISSVGSDRTIEMIAPGAGDDARYTTALEVNGTSTTASWLPETFAQEGGTLRYTMSDTPGTWGTGEDDVPPSYRDGENARNGVGIVDDGAVNMGGLDDGGTAISRQDLEAAGVTGGSRVELGETGVTFTWPDAEPGTPDHWIPHGQVLEFGGVEATGISFLGLATNGAARGTAVVTYTDGTTRDVEVRFSDWVPGSLEPGNSRVIELTKRNTIRGEHDSARPVVFATAVAGLDETKQVDTVTLPTAVSGGLMHIFDVALRPADDQPGGEEPTLPTRPTPQPPTEPTIPEPGEGIDGQVLLDTSATWAYLDDGVDPATGLDSLTAWTRTDVDDSNWKRGTGSFGAKRGVIDDLGGGFRPTTLLTQYKPGTQTNIEAFFFRTQVELTAAQLEQIDSLRGTIAYDDAARVYVNGERVAGFRDARIDASTTTNMVYAGDNESAPSVGEFTVPGDLLVEGTNTIAVQVHNTNATSSDVFMQLTELIVVGADAPVVVSDVVLTVGSDQTQRNLTFYTDREVAGQVQVAPAAAREGDTFPVEAATVLDATTTPTHDGRFSHKATLTGLEEETAYLYRVGNDEMGWSRSYETWTGTYDDTYSYVLVGDIQIGASGSWQGDRDRWALASQTFAEKEPDASMILSVGDQVESHRAEHEYASLFAPPVMQELPFVPTIGNHDNQSTAYDTHFFTPNRSTEHGYEPQEGRAGGDYWYIYNDVLYLNLNSNARSEGEQDHIEFMEKVIAEHGQDVNWTVAIWHHSIYSAAFHSVEQDVQERRAALAPAMSELGVDLVLGGHDHIYTRSYLMEGTEPVGDLAEQERLGAVLTPEEGQVLYVTVNSSSGSKFYGLDARSPQAAVKDQSNQPQYTDVDVSPEAITLTTYHTYDGRVVDKVTITQDIDAPILDGVPTHSEVAQGSSFDPLEGVSAHDEVDGDLTQDIVVEGEVDTRVPGTYELVYTVTDAAGNEATATRTVTVTAVKPTFSGVLTERTVTAGEEFDPLEGVRATDANGEDLTDRITVELVGQDQQRAALVAPAPGTYQIVYSVTDAYGTTATATTTLTVVQGAGGGTDPGDGDGDGTDPGGSGPGADGGDEPGADGGATDPDKPDAKDQDGGLLPATGSAVTPWMLLGLLAAVAGAALLVRRRVPRP